MEAIETTRKGDYILEIFQDDFYDSPRSWDPLGTMVCFHGRYNLGDKHDYNNDDYSTWTELKEAIIEGENAKIILPLYLYDHSGITMNTTGFSCGWDSGPGGWIFASEDRIKKEYNVDVITDDILEKVTNVLKGEVETYDQYLTGDVYGYRVSKVEMCDKGCEHEEELNSCWGFYGMDSVEEEGGRVLDYYLEKA
jgi:hypothetical protein